MGCFVRFHWCFLRFSVFEADGWKIIFALFRWAWHDGSNVEEGGMHPVLNVVLWLAVVYFALQALWIIFSVVLCGGVGVWALLLWIRRNPWVIVVVAAVAAAVIITACCM